MTISVIPRTTEKAYAASLNRVYVFDVPLSANKNQIKAAVASQFDVTVLNVKTLVQQGKSVRFSRGKRRYPGTTTRNDTKKAYVTLAEGNEIKVFDQQTAVEKEK